MQRKLPASSAAPRNALLKIRPAISISPPRRCRMKWYSMPRRPVSIACRPYRAWHRSTGDIRIHFEATTLREDTETFAARSRCGTLGPRCGTARSPWTDCGSDAGAWCGRTMSAAHRDMARRVPLVGDTIAHHRVICASCGSSCMRSMASASLIASDISPALAGAPDWPVSPPNACAWMLKIMRRGARAALRSPQWAMQFGLLPIDLRRLRRLCTGPAAMVSAEQNVG